MAKKAKATTESNLDAMVEAYLAKNEKKKVMEKEIAALKEDIEAQITFEKRQFVDGELVLATGLVKEVAAAPSLVWAKTGKSLTPADREKLAGLFPEQYRKLDINTKLVSEVAGTNQDVAKALGEGGLTLSQGTNLQIKAI